MKLQLLQRVFQRMLTDIQKELEHHLRTSDVPTLKALAAIVKKLKWPRGGSHGVEGYYLQRQG